jgi:hypothetical protein
VANDMLSASALCERKFLKVGDFVIVGGREASFIPEGPFLGQEDFIYRTILFGEQNGTEEYEYRRAKWFSTIYAQ